MTETAGGTLQSVELPDNGVATKNSAAYTHNADGTYTPAGFTGATTKIDFDDVTLKDNTTYTLTLAVSKAGGANGFFVGIGNVALINTPLVVTSTWNGTEGHSTWSDSNAWSGTPFVDGGAAVFDGTADIKTATVTSNVSADSVTVSGAAHTFELAGGNLTTGKLTVGDGGSLTLTGAGTVAASAIDASGKTITINEGVVLTGAGSGTLDGKGRYVLADGSAAIGGMQLADTWAGVVAINGAAFADNGTRLNTLNGLSKADSWVALKGTSGWSGGTEISANLLLEKGTDDWAFQQNNGNNNTTLSFTGKIKGDGKLGRGNGTGSTYTYAFSGDISGWTGTFQSYSNDNQSTTFRVSGAATSVKANLVNARGTFKVDVQNSATFDGSVDATALTVAGNQTATFNGTTAIGNGVTLGSGAKLVNGGTLTLGGTVTFGGKAIENNGGTVHFGNNLVFNLDGLTPSEEEAGVHTYTLFSGSTSVNLSTLGVANITLTDGTSGKVWSFSDHGTVSWTLPSELEWDNTTGNNKWSYSDANWHGSVFVENAAANFYQDATVEVSGDVVASAIAVGNGEAAANVTISAGEASSLTATTLQVDNGSLTTNVTIQGLGSNTVAAGATWHIAADQTIAAGAIDGSVDVAQGKTVTLVQAATAKDLLLGITGQGNIALGTNVSFNSSDDAAAASTKATGTLTLKEGVKLTVGNNKDKTASIASFGHVVMEQGAGIDTKSRLVEINNLTVNTAATSTDVIKMLDTYSKDEIGLNLKGTTTLNGNLEINSDWKYKVNIEQLAGTGSLNLTGGSEEHRAVIGDVDINSLTVTNKMTNVDITGTVALSGVLGVNGTTNVTGENSMTVGGLTGSAALNVANGITFNVAEGGNYSYTGTLTVGGQIVKQGTGTQTIGGTALHHTVLAQGGTLVLNGTYEIKDIAEGEHQTVYVDASDQVNENGGFQKNEGKLTVYSMNTEAGANLVDTNAVFTYKGVNVTGDVVNGEYTLPSAPDMSTLYVKKGNLAFAAYKAKAGENLTTVSLADGTAIDMNEAASINLVMENAASATVNATAATTFNAVTGLAAAQQLVVSGDETVTLGSAVTGNKILVNNGHLNLGTLTHSLSELSVTNGTVDVAGVDSKYGCVSGTLTIGESGTVTTVGHHDVFGYNDGATDKIVLRGAENKLAQLVLNSPNANSVTMTTDIEMYGYSAITSTKGDSDKGFNTYGGTIKVEGVENSISVLDMRHDGVTINVAENGALEIKKVTIFGNQHGANTILVKAGEGALTLSGASDLTDGLTINAGSVEIGGVSTIGNLAGTGDLVVKAGGSLNVTGSVTDTTITVEDGGTIAGGVDAKDVTIAAGGTAKFNEGINDTTAGVYISNVSEGAPTVTNNGGTDAKYAGLQDASMTVTAETLMSEAAAPVVVNNGLAVKSIAHEGTGELTLAHVDAVTLEGVYAYDGALSLQNITSVSLTEMTIAPEATVAVYQGGVAEANQEGTVTITDTLTAGGGTLLANLTIEASEGDAFQWDLGGTTMTLGSTLKLVTADGLIQLDDKTMQNIAGLQTHESYELVLDGAGDLTYIGEGWWDQVFTRSYGEGNGLVLTGDYQVGLLDSGNFGVTKLSNVPEPTTGTLSLLALAGLCARRRRK